MTKTSLAREIILINHAYLTSLSISDLFFDILALITPRIEKLQRNFLLLRVGKCKKDHLINWDIMFRLEELARFRIGKLEEQPCSLEQVTLEAP